MILRLQAELQMRSTLSKIAPRVNLPSGLRWNEESALVEIEIPALPEQAARLLVRGGFQQDPENKYSWAPVKKAERGSLQILVIATAEEWEQLEKAISKLPRSKPLKPLTQMHLEWPLGHPAFHSLKAGDFPLGDIILRLLPEDDQIVLLAPIDVKGVEDLKNSGYALQPIDDWQEEIWWEQLEMGRLLKPEMLMQENDPQGAPFLALHGMQNSLAHPVFMRPFLPPLEGVDHNEMRRIIQDTIESSTELQLAWDMEESSESDATFHQEYLGFNRDDLDLLLRAHIAISENLSDPYFEIADLEEDEEDDWLSHVFSLMVTASVCGSRFARAELARSGYDTSLDNRLGDRDCMDLASGILHFTDALYDAVGDDRAAHIWSLDRRTSRIAEQILDDTLLDAMPAGVDPELVVYDLYLSFDLGVRYQMARVAPLLLVPHGYHAELESEDAADSEDKLG